MSGNFKQVKTLANLVPKDHQGDIEDSDPWRPAWNPSGTLLALPGSKHVTVIGRVSWQRAFELKDVHAEAVSLVLWSPNGLYLVSYSVDKMLVAWDVSKAPRPKVNEIRFDEKQQAVKWFGCSRGVASLNLGGDYWILDQLIQPSLPDPCSELTAEQQQELASQVPVMQEPPVQDEPVLPQKPAEAPTAKAKGNTDTTGEDTASKSGHEEDNEGTSLNEIKAKLGFGASEEEERQRMVEQLEDTSEEAMLDTSSPAEDIPADPISRGSAVELDQLKSLISRQVAFQPGSTEANANNSRYLAWNSVGVITSHSDAGLSSIEIDFADMKFHRKVRFTDHYGLQLGSLSECGALFASPGTTDKDESRDPYDNRDENSLGKVEAKAPEVRSILAKTLEEAERNEAGNIEEKDEEEEGERSVLFFKPFHGLVSNAEWLMRLPQGERAMNVACGSSFCAVATNRRLLRVLRPDGTQEVPVLLGGPVVAMAGGGSYLLVAFHLHEPSLNGTQSIGFILYEVCPQGSDTCLDVVTKGSLPLPYYESQPLKWLGVADRSLAYMPLFADCSGSIYGLSAFAKFSWVPITKQTKRLWPVAVSSGAVLGVMLTEGKEVGPRVLPRPVLSTLTPTLPMIGLEEGKVGALKFKLEESALNASLVLEQKRWLSTVEGAVDQEEEDLDLLSKQVDAKIIKHFVLCLKLQKLDRAMGLVCRLRSIDAMEIAHMQATKEPNAAPIVEKVEAVIAQRKEEAAQDEAGEDSMSAEEDMEELAETQDLEPSPRNQLSFSQKQPKNPFAKKTMALSPGTKPVNPFAKSSQPASQSHSKTRGKHGSSKSPPVTITPKLGRQSSFSQEARSSTKRRRVESSR